MIYVIIGFFVFFLGASIGSFVTMLSYRLKHGGDIFFGRSQCVKCEYRLGVLDLVPIGSYLVLRGKCRSCGEKYGRRYFLIEFFSGAVFLFLYVISWTRFELLSLEWIMFMLFLLLFVFLIVFVFVYDLWYSIIPDAVLGVVFGLCLIFAAVLGIDFIIHAFLGSFVFGFLMLFVFRIFGDEKMGAGDVKYAFVLGFFLGGMGSLYAFGASFVIGAVVSLYFLMKKSHSLQSQLPFGVFMSIGSLLALIFVLLG